MLRQRPNLAPGGVLHKEWGREGGFDSSSTIFPLRLRFCLTHCFALHYLSVKLNWLHFIVALSRVEVLKGTGLDPVIVVFITLHCIILR